MHDAEFNHPLLVQVYDVQRVWSAADQLFFDLAAENLAVQRPGARVLDLGCGTGRLALRLAAAGHRVTGIDPARASLEAARRKPGAAQLIRFCSDSRDSGTAPESLPPPPNRTS